jgi:membrane protease subunit HflC
MRLNLAGGVIAALIIVALIVAYGALFTVYQTRQALVIRLGQPVRVVTQPGLHSKVPLIDSVISIDKRILDLENPAQEVIASDQKRLVVDAFARYSIKEPLKFYQTVGTVDGANLQLSILLNSALRRVLGEATLTQVVRDEREHLMARVREQLGTEAKAYGIDVVDVRIRRADLPEQNSQAVYQRMQTERQQEAAQIRAQGNQRSQEIRAKADRDVTVLLADAQSKGEQTRGEGDGSGLLLVLPFDAGLRGGSAPQRHAHAAQARHGVLSLLRRSVGQAERPAARSQARSGRRRELAERSPPPRHRLGRDGPVHRCDRSRARHRGTAVRRLPPRRQAAGGERAGEPGNIAAGRGHRLCRARSRPDLDRARMSGRGMSGRGRAIGDANAPVPIPPQSRA